MITRRSVLAWLGAAARLVLGRSAAVDAAVTASLRNTAAATGAAAVSAAAAPPGSYAALLARPVQWFFDDAADVLRPADDVFEWLDWHVPERVVERARLGLEERIGPGQLGRLIERRTRDHCVEIHLPFGSHAKTDCDEPAPAWIHVRHWGRPPHGMRTLFVGLGLDPHTTIVKLTDCRRDSSHWANGADCLAGRPLVAGPDLERLGGKWQRRARRAPPDWSAATDRDWGLRWPQLAGPGIPWAALASAWRGVDQRTCGDCAAPLILCGFGRTRDGGGGVSESAAMATLQGGNPAGAALRAVAEFVCAGCARRVEEPIDDLDAWLESHLEPAFRPGPGPATGPAWPSTR